MLLLAQKQSTSDNDVIFPYSQAEAWMNLGNRMKNWHVF